VFFSSGAGAVRLLILQAFAGPDGRIRRTDLLGIAADRQYPTEHPPTGRHPCAVGWYATMRRDIK